MESESESNVKLILENATAEAHEEGCLQENATPAARFGNRCDTVENATAEAHEQGYLTMSGACTAAGNMQPVGPWSRGPLACDNQSAMTKKCICQFWTRCGISYAQWCGV